MDIVHFTQVSLSGVISGQRRRNFANIAHHVSEKKHVTFGHSVSKCGLIVKLSSLTGF